MIFPRTRINRYINAMYTTGLATIYIFSSGHVRCRAPVPLGRIPPFVYDRDKFSNHEQSKTNKKDENTM